MLEAKKVGTSLILIARDKVDLHITWLKDDSLADPDTLPDPAVLVAEINDEMKAIMR